MQNEQERIIRKNQADWDLYSSRYMAYNHSDEKLAPIIRDPSDAFEPSAWSAIREHFPDLKGMKVCVPSSGDNHAVFAFALLGAQVTSCDISQNQLDAACVAAQRLGIADRIRFQQENTMTLDGLPDAAYDLVYTSNGVHVWLNDLPAMYHAIKRILKPGGVYIMCDVHPFQRPYGEEMKIIKAYDAVGPFEDEYNITFTWRTQDFINAMADAGLRILHMEEQMPIKDYDEPFFYKHEDLVNGKKPTKEEVDRMYDVRYNPQVALPEWLCITAKN